MGLISEDLRYDTIVNDDCKFIYYVDKRCKRVLEKINDFKYFAYQAIAKEVDPTGVQGTGFGVKLI